MQQLLTYRVITRLAALLLSVGMVFPAGLCATQLSHAWHDSEMANLDESAHGSMHHSDRQSPDDGDVHTLIPDSGHQVTTRPHMPDGDMCESHTGSQTTNDRTPSNDCMDSLGCSCELGQALPDYQLWPKAQGNAVIAPAPVTVTPEDHDDRLQISIHRSQRHKAPPLFLLNSTFLT